MFYRLERFHVAKESSYVASRLARATLPVLVLLALPSTGLAQASASIAGVVRDSSGAVLPGVTVEASSPALIEKTRTTVTDGAGQYRIEQLRGGVYTVTFTLTGFQTVRREGVELTGSFAATVNAELKVGAVAETITVTGEAPMVDIQSATRQRVIDQELLVAIPTGRTPQVAAFLIPGVNLSNVDVGGTNIINTTGGSLSIHGGSLGDTRLLIDGVTIANTEGTGWSSQHAAEHGQHAGGGGRLLVGDRREHHRRPADQHDPEDRRQHVLGHAVRDRGATPAFEGIEHRRRPASPAACARPTAEVAVRRQSRASAGRCARTGCGSTRRRDSRRQANYVGGLFQNPNAGDITKWTYEPDTREAARSTRPPNRASICA